MKKTDSIFTPVFKLEGFNELDWYPLTNGGTALVCKFFGINSYILDNLYRSPWSIAVQTVNKLIGNEYKILSLFDMRYSDVYGRDDFETLHIVILTDMPDSKIYEIPEEMKPHFRYALGHSVYGDLGENPDEYYSKKL